MNEFMVNFKEKMQVIEEMARALNVRIEMLEAENTELRAKLNDGWSDRVTFENVVEQIASNEDPAQRDEARKIFEPMLKKEMARKLRAEIKRKVKEMIEETTPQVQKIDVQGDYVVNKNVSKEVNGVAARATGIIIN